MKGKCWPTSLINSTINKRILTIKATQNYEKK